MLRKTKIVATLGPSVNTLGTMKALLHAGMNVARFNFSHGNHDEHHERLRLLRQASKETGITAACMLDTKGPEIRTGKVMNNGSIHLQSDQKVIITTENIPCTKEMLSVTYKNLPAEVYAGSHIFIADGLIDLEVIKIQNNTIHCIVRNGGIMGSWKNVNVPGIRTALPAVTEKDIADIQFGVSIGMDFIAASFIRKAEDVEMVKSVLHSSHSSARVIAKIEDEEGVSNITNIARHASGVMVARGDLGVQLNTVQIPLVQKRIIHQCNLHNTPVITATQMLESMTANPKPTRAELTDVANAIFDGTDAVMLSGETANGKYPAESVEMLHKIAAEVEASQEYIEHCKRQFFTQHESTNIADAVTKATHVVARNIDAAAIVTPTLRGNSPRLLSRYRAKQPIIAVTTSESVYRQLLLSWGIYPLLTKHTNSFDTMLQNALSIALKAGYIRRNNIVITAAGIPINSPIMMNTIRVHFLGNILARGRSGFGMVFSGNIIKAVNAAQALSQLSAHKKDILLIPEMTKEYTALIPSVGALIIEGNLDMETDIKNKNPDIVLVADVQDAYQKFENNQSVSVSGNEKVIYEGYIE